MHGRSLESPVREAHWGRTAESTAGKGLSLARSPAGHRHEGQGEWAEGEVLGQGCRGRHPGIQAPCAPGLVPMCATFRSECPTGTAVPEPEVTLAPSVRRVCSEAEGQVTLQTRMFLLLRFPGGGQPCRAQLSKCKC